MLAKRRPPSPPSSARPLTPPQSPEIERAVLGALQHAPEVGRALARLEARDFASEGHGTILGAIEALHAQGRRADLPQLADMLEQSGDLVDVGGQAYLASLDVDVDLAYLDDYIDRLKEFTALREAAASAQQFVGGLGIAVPAQIPAALADLEARLAGVSASIESKHDGRSRCLAEIAPESVGFLWRPYLPVGKLTLLEGDPGQGKSFLAAALAANGSRGRGLPGAEPSEPWSTLMLTAEDGLADTLRPRLDRLGADVDRIFGVEDLLDLSSAEGLSTLERAIADCRPRLVIIDPVVAYVGARTDLHRANQVRAVLGPLARLVAKTRTVILAIRHLNKTPPGRCHPSTSGELELASAIAALCLHGMPRTLRISGTSLYEVRQALALHHRVGDGLRLRAAVHQTQHERASILLDGVGRLPLIDTLPEATLLISHPQLVAKARVAADQWHRDQREPAIQALRKPRESESDHEDCRSAVRSGAGSRRCQVAEYAKAPAVLHHQLCVDVPALESEASDESS